ncbi:MAG: L,D-transpeptidase family protein [Crocinitomicaceae bacterium]
MLKVFNLLIIGLFFMSSDPQTGFKEKQKTYSRVRTAYSEKESSLKKELEAKGFEFSKINKIFIRALKKEMDLEVWIQKSDGKYHLFKTYKFCSFSGILGPKMKQGDLQIPEGVYTIDRFNPWSNFYLSLGVSYPNKADRINSPYKSKGGDIFIHGNCVTIGCIPITDEFIKEFYVLCVESKNKGHEIPVHIFPFRMNFDLKTIPSYSEYAEGAEKLWPNLQPIFKDFEEKKTLSKISIDEKGKYFLQ